MMVNAGANAGSLTLTAASVPGVQVFAVEPHPMTYSVLATNVAINTDRYAALLLPQFANAFYPEEMLVLEKDPRAGRNGTQPRVSVAGTDRS